MRDQVFTPEPLADLFPKLLVTNLIASMAQRVTQKYCDHNAHCEFYSGEIGHDVNNCWTLKRRVRELIDNGNSMCKLSYIIRIPQQSFPKVSFFCVHPLVVSLS